MFHVPIEKFRFKSYVQYIYEKEIQKNVNVKTKQKLIK